MAGCVISMTLAGCNKNNNTVSPTPPITPSPIPAAEVLSTANIDRNTKYQTIDGFGFFGAKGVWWDNPGSLYNDAWATQVITDLGITIWRNELYPPATATVSQDADWAKQQPVVEGLAKIALANRVPLKFIFTVWSPPADLKCAVDASGTALSGTPHPGGTKNGGTLDPAKYEQFGNWLADAIQLYKNLGIDVYAFSPQNEPLFSQSFNSCSYRGVSYANMVKNVVPVVKAKFPKVKVFGSENMLEMEGGKDRQYFFNAALNKDAAALSNIDILAIHGYSDGVSATASSALATLWNTTKTEHAIPAGKPYWMTETSGYSENWLGNSTQKSGAINLAMDIHSALYNGNAAAWVWWQGSSNSGISDYELMKSTELKGKKYYVSKHFYRFIRPGAKMVKLTYDETVGIFASAYEHTTMGAFTIVLINNSDKQVKLNLAGANLPNEFDYYLTTAATTDNCTKKTTTVTKDNVVLPARSVVTLVNGKVIE
ncbi:MAG: hypothetical protein ACRC2O_01115 [Chitinophagaceae bacterium]